MIGKLLFYAHPQPTNVQDRIDCYSLDERWWQNKLEIMRNLGYILKVKQHLL